LLLLLLFSVNEKPLNSKTANFL